MSSRSVKIDEVLGLMRKLNCKLKENTELMIRDAEAISSTSAELLREVNFMHSDDGLVTSLISLFRIVLKSFSDHATMNRDYYNLQAETIELLRKDFSSPN